MVMVGCQRLQFDVWVLLVVDIFAHHFGAIVDL